MNKLTTITSLAAGLMALSVNGIVVSFDDANRGPASLLNINGVTVVGEFGENVATVAGVGLGATFISPNGYVDRTVSIDTLGDSHSFGEEGLQFSVDGKINSITIETYFSVLQGEPFSPGVEVSTLQIDTGGATSRDYHFIAAGATRTFSFLAGFLPSGLIIDLKTDFGLEPMLSSYIHDHPGSAAQFQWGFTVKSIDYTPNAVPDGGATAALLALSFMAVASIRRKMI